jgi:CheY-like chemotaxis protein/DNA-directed RNA polymerase specialized sigma24 family protein
MRVKKKFLPGIDYNRGGEMNQFQDEIARNLTYLRRYARALTGSQRSGDGLVRACLETLLEEPERISKEGDGRIQLFKLFHQVWQRLAAPENGEGSEPLSLTIEERLQALPARERQVLLLTALEGFSVYDAAEIIGVDDATAQHLLAEAWANVNEQIATTVLVIEDEPIIALDIVGLVQEMGHSVIGIASSRAEAVSMARSKEPGLVLADIHLGEGGSGLVAVREILQSMEVPVVFVTAYPERLLTGERPEPTYLVTKPFGPDTLKVTISQALSARPAIMIGGSRA